MSILKISGAVILAGSIAFLVAAFLPISRVYGLTNAEDKLAMITDNLRVWGISQVLFSLGVIVATLGVALAAYSLKDQPSASFLITAAAFLVVSAVAWVWHAYLRTTDPTAFVNGSLPSWHFIIYTLLTLAGFLLIGIALPRMGFSIWIGWVLGGGALLFFVLYLIFKDIPPFVHYLLGLVLAFVLMRGR
jgi:hypothetical protein